MFHRVGWLVNWPLFLGRVGDLSSPCVKSVSLRETSPAEGVQLVFNCLGQPAGPSLWALSSCGVCLAKGFSLRERSSVATTEDVQLVFHSIV